MPRGQPGGPGFQFIPHSLQRHMPTPRPTMNSVPPPNQPHHHLQQQMAAAGHALLPSPQMHSHVINTAHGPVVNIDAATSAAGPSNSVTGATSKTKGKGKGNEQSKKKKGKKNLRVAGGTLWEDTTLQEWDPNDFRIFCGDLGNDVTEDVLTRAFNKYPSFQKAKVVRCTKTNKTKGYGFVSFKDPQDFSRAMRDMNGNLN